MAGDRRSFLKKAGGITAVVAAGPVGLVAAGADPHPAEAAGSTDRGFVTGILALVLEREGMGFLQSADGGVPFAEVVEEAAVPGDFVQKHLGGVQYEDLTIEFGPGLDDALYDWVSASMIPGRATRRNGAIIALDFNFEERQRREFVDALISEVRFPACDAASKEMSSLAVTLVPEATSLATAGPLPDFAKAKIWLASNFRFSLGNLPCNRVSKIESFALKMTVTGDQHGQSQAAIEPNATVEVPNLKVTFSLLDFPAWQQFFDDFVLDGNNEQADELSGKIEYLDVTLSEVLFTLELRQVGIFGLAPDPPDPETGNVARATADLYVDEMSFAVGATT